MKCTDCKDFIGGICMVAQEGRISTTEDIRCLLVCQISLMRGIWEALAIKDDPDDDWKV